MDTFILKVLLLLGPTITGGRIISAPRKPRLSLAEPNPSYFYRNIDGHPDTYSFGYDLNDPSTSNQQFRTEERYPNGTVVGSYGYVDAAGRPHSYSYVADERGYRVSSMRTKEPTGIRQTYQPNLSIETSNSESSITWTRPRKPTKKKITYNWYEAPNETGKNYLMKNRPMLQYPYYYKH